MATSSLQLARSYTSFAGSDIRGIVNGETFMNLQAVSFAIQREKAPVYVMGYVDPRSFSRGKRGIAGTLVTLMFDQHILFSRVMQDKFFLADNDEIYASVTDLNNGRTGEDLDNVSNINGGDVLNPEFNEGDLGSNYQVSRAWYVDQLPPFDIVIVAANEHGQAATMRIYGVEILNEGSGFSVDDVQIENQMTYVCRTILPWQRLGRWNMDTRNGAFEAYAPGQFGP